ncbi:hypothetical protein ACWEKM_35195 [Streptomyces sp. NPDC004752]
MSANDTPGLLGHPGESTLVEALNGVFKTELIEGQGSEREFGQVKRAIFESSWIRTPKSQTRKELALRITRTAMNTALFHTDRHNEGAQ